MLTITPFTPLHPSMYRCRKFSAIRVHCMWVTCSIDNFHHTYYSYEYSAILDLFTKTITTRCFTHVSTTVQLPFISVQKYIQMKEKSSLNKLQPLYPLPSVVSSELTHHTILKLLNMFLLHSFIILHHTYLILHLQICIF